MNASIKQFILPITLSFWGIISYSQTNNGSGNIYFTDGTVKSFNIIKSISMTVPPSSTGSGTITLGPESELKVFYENSIRRIPFNKLKSITLKPDVITNGSVKGRIDVNTITGINFSSPILLLDIQAYIFDELIGEAKIQRYTFGNGSRLLISKIEFD